MFSFYWAFTPALMHCDFAAAKAAQARFDSMTPEEKMLDLKKREVQALESQAQAMHERNRIERGKFF